MIVEVDLDFNTIEKIIITDLKWHAEQAEDLEGVETLRRVLHYYTGGNEYEL